MSEDRRHYDRSQNGGRDPHRDRDYRDKRKEGERRDQNHHRYREDREPKHGRRSRESDYPHRERDTSPYRNSPERPEAYTPASVPPAEMAHYKPQPKEALYNLRYLLTARGLCQIVDFFINMMIVVCAGVFFKTPR
ncbi:hypothetical protein GJAV_G00232450 [Gymnothorax javanicus]|nr:hypothetical protein GJAV_G00232450 [Gymnothorax javanicus]